MKQFGVWVLVLGAAFAAACGSRQETSGSDAATGGANAAGGAAGSSSTECVVGDQRSCDQGGLYGPCAAGTQTCQADGVWGSCSIQPAATDGCEAGNDDDCDGTPNEGCTCVVGQIRSCAQSGALGNCAAGEQSCDSTGTWGSCSIQPASADDCVAPGDDANCNGTPNEGCPCVEGQKQPCGSTPEVGQCHAGESLCTDGSWGACQGVVYPAVRDCSSADDNDCDGVADNVLDEQCRCAPAATEACDTHPGLDGVGTCQAGSRTCTAVGDGSLSDWSACVGSVAPLNEVCDGATDENCDGQVDEGCGGTGGTGGSGGTTGGSAGSVNGGTSGTPTGGSGGNGGSVAGTGPVCPGATPWPEGTLVCRTPSDCPPGYESCLPGYTPPVRDCPTDCSIQIPSDCRQDTDCDSGQVCVGQHEECCDEYYWICAPPCTATSCPADERCGTSGKCEALPCTEGYTCPTGTRCGEGDSVTDTDLHGCTDLSCTEGYTCESYEICDPEAPYQNTHDCAAVTCTGMPCPVNTVCGEDYLGRLICNTKTCSTDADCDCGACVDETTTTKICAVRLNRCALPGAGLGGTSAAGGL